MPGAIGAKAFTDCYKHRECLGGIRLQTFLTNGHFIYRGRGDGEGGNGEGG